MLLTLLNLHNNIVTIECPLTYTFASCSSNTTCSLFLIRLAHLYLSYLKDH